MDFKAKIIGAGLLFAVAAPSALADQFYIDVGADFGGNGYAQANGNNTTGWLDEMTYVYQSSTLVTDADLNGPDAGDTIVTTGGFIAGDFGSVQFNNMSGFNPTQTIVDPSSPSYNGFGTSWGITFQFELFGTLGAGLSTDFTSGDITFYYYDGTMVGTTNFTELFTISVSATQQSVGGPRLTGEVSSVGTDMVNTVAAGDVFNFATGSFGDHLDAFMQIFASVDFNTDAGIVTSTDNGDGTWTLTGQHDGSVSFAIPEPSALAVMALGLLTLAGLGRRNRKA